MESLDCTAMCGCHLAYQNEEWFFSLKF